MKNLVKLITFILLTIIVFFISNYIALLSIFFLDLILTIIFKISIREYFKSFKYLLPFLLLSFVLNVIFSNLDYAILILFRIIICYNITFTYYKVTSVLEIANTIQMIFSPLKIFKIDTSSISLIISIALCMIPILQQEINSVRNAIKAKGAKIKITNITLVLKPILISMLQRTGEIEKALITGEIEKALIAKGFME